MISRNRLTAQPINLWALDIPPDAQTVVIAGRPVQLERQPIPWGRGVKLWARCPDCGRRCRHFYAGTCRLCAGVWYCDTTRAARHLTRKQHA